MHDMTSSLRRAAVLAVWALCQASCSETCKDTGCAEAGAVWLGVSAEPLEAGTYMVAIQLDEARYEASCTLDATRSSCGIPKKTEEGPSFKVFVRAESNGRSQPIGFYIQAERTEVDGDSVSILGPQILSISIAGPGVDHGSDHMIAYRQDDAYRGEDCGICEQGGVEVALSPQ